MARRQNRQIGWVRIMSMLSYFAIIFIGIALLISAIASGNVSNAFMTVAWVLAIIVIGFHSFKFAFSRGVHRIWWVVFWVAAMTLIIVSLILGTFNLV